MIDYVVHLQARATARQRQGLQAEQAHPGPRRGAITITGSRASGPISTRALLSRPEHTLAIQVNGQRLARQTFWLEEASDS
jgi:hypothetical protein